VPAFRAVAAEISPLLAASSAWSRVSLIRKIARGNARSARLLSASRALEQFVAVRDLRQRWLDHVDAALQQFGASRVKPGSLACPRC